MRLGILYTLLYIKPVLGTPCYSWSVEYEKIMLIKAVVDARVVSPCFWYIELLSPFLAGSVRLLKSLTMALFRVISDCYYIHIYE